MGHIYDDRHEILIPSEAHINRSDARVYLIDAVDSRRTVIGKATSETTMFPNDMFKKLYPDIWKKEYAKYNDPPVYEMKMGMYGLCLGAVEKNGLYKTLLKAYDAPKHVNAIMDFAMYSILNRRNVAQLYSTKMIEEVVFSEEIYEDTWWSEFFKEKLTESQHMEFRELWLKRCQEKGIRKTWLCIDGSNNDCQMQDSKYAEPGHNKSHTVKNIVGYIWAVNADDGMPITYYVSPGGEVDSQSIQWLITFLAGYNFEVEGVILDRGFATIDVLNLLNGLQIDYVIMLPDCYGTLSMADCYGDTIFWNPEYLVNGSNLYGISKEERIRKKSFRE